MARGEKWEYRSARLDVGGWVGPKVDLAALDATLSAIGAEGWELVNAIDLNQSDGKTTAIVALFKRQR
jgi:hypothetical protein